jgi:hypothetical protein
MRRRYFVARARATAGSKVLLRRSMGLTLTEMGYSMMVQ